MSNFKDYNFNYVNNKKIFEPKVNNFALLDEGFKPAESDLQRNYKNTSNEKSRLLHLTDRIRNINLSLEDSKIQKENKAIPFENTQIAGLIKSMAINHYDLEKVSYTKEVPNFFVSNIPQDIALLDDSNIRKKVFISIVLPLIVRENQGIELQRNKLQKIYDNLKISKTLSVEENIWLINLAAKYSIPTQKIHKIKIVQNLLKHVDIIPNSIAIAQAAKESGWGTSRFALEGNALYGQWTYNSNIGLLPIERNEGDSHFVRSFVDLRESVVSYMENINSHSAYESFRNKRAQYRNNNIGLDPSDLVRELAPYAELPNYTDILKKIIDSNKLYNFDNVNLVEPTSLV